MSTGDDTTMDRDPAPSGDDERRPSRRFAAICTGVFLSSYGIAVFAVLSLGWFSPGRGQPDDVDPPTAVDDVPAPAERPTLRVDSGPTDGRIDELGQRDEYTLCTSRTDFLTIRMVRSDDTAEELLDPYLEVFSTVDGELITLDDDSAGSLNAQVVLAPTDVISCHLVVARSLGDASIGDYTLTVETGAPDVVIEPGVSELDAQPADAPDVADQPRIELAVPTELQAEIDEPGQMDSYTVCSSPTDVVTIRMERPIDASPDALDPYLDVYTEDGTYLGGDDDGGGDGNSLIQLEPGTDCFLVVAGDVFLEGTGKYLLITAAGEPRPVDGGDGGTVDFEALYAESFADLSARSVELTGSRARATIGEPGQVDPYSVCGSETDTITIEMVRASGSSNADLDPLLSLYSEDGALVAVDDDGGEGGNSMIVLPSGDGCYVLVASDSFRRSTGNYAIVVTAG